MTDPRTDATQLTPEELAELESSHGGYLEPKVKAGGTAGAATIVLVYVVGLLGVELPPEVASAVTVLFSSTAGYLR